jgi:hypothetical protein
VLGLARSGAGAKSHTDAGAQVHRGEMEHLESLRSGAAMLDGVIHTAFNHDFSKFAANCEMDRRAIEALGSALAGSDRPWSSPPGQGSLRHGALRRKTMCPLPAPPRFPEFRSRQQLRWRRVEYGRQWWASRRSMTGLSKASLPTRSLWLARRCLGVCWRRAQPLARSAPARCCPRLQAGA